MDKFTAIIKVEVTIVHRRVHLTTHAESVTVVHRRVNKNNNRFNFPDTVVDDKHFGGSYHMIQSGAYRLSIIYQLLCAVICMFVPRISYFR